MVIVTLLHVIMVPVWVVRMGQKWKEAVVTWCCDRTAKLTAAWLVP
jgi:hypothetical protein